MMGRSPSIGGGGPGSRPGSRGGSPVPIRRSSAAAAGAAIVGVGSRPGSRAPSPRNSARSDAGNGNYQKHDLVEYWSVSHNEWLPATVIDADAAGKIIIDLKPNTWISKEDQTSKVRRRAGQAGTPSGRPGSRGPGFGAESPQIRRTPSLDRFGAPVRAPSPRRAPSPSRAQSPAGRAASPSGWRGVDAPGRAASPCRRFDAGTPRRPPGFPPPGGPRVSDSPRRPSSRGYGY